MKGDIHRFHRSPTWEVAELWKSKPSFAINVPCTYVKWSCFTSVRAPWVIWQSAMYPLQSSFLAREQHEVQSSAVLKSVLWSLRHIGSKARETLCHEEQLDEWDNTRHAIDWFHLTAPTRGTSHNSKPHARMQYGAEAALIAMGANDPRPAELTTLKYPPGGKMELWGYMTQDINPHLITINGIVNSTLKLVRSSVEVTVSTSATRIMFFSATNS